MNEGWLRLRLDDLKFPYTTLHNADIATPAKPLREAFDVIVLPSNSPNSIKNGSSSSTTPPEYRGGITQAGVDNLKVFVEAGGVLALNGNSSAFPITFGWPINVVQATAAIQAAAALEQPPAKVQELREMMTNEGDEEPDPRPVGHVNGCSCSGAICPGSILAVKVDSSSPVAYGYNRARRGRLRHYPFFDIASGSGSTVVARYPEDRDALLSGYLTGGDGLRGKAAIVDALLGEGHVVMFGTDVIYRGQSTGDFMFLFNAMLMGGPRSERCPLAGVSRDVD